MFSRRLRILLSVQKQLSRVRFQSAAITRQVNLKTVCNDQQKTITNSKQIHTLSPALHQYVKHSNSQSQNSQLKYDNDEENDSESEEEDAESSEKGTGVRLTENLYAYKILKNSSKVSTIVPLLIPEEDVPEDVVARILEKNHEDYSPTEVLEDFRLLSFHRGRQKTGLLTAEKHQNILQTLKKYLNDFSDEELWSLFQYIELWYPMKLSTKQPLLIELEKAMDQECLMRMNIWSVDEWLKTCDLWYHLRQLRESKFVFRCMKKLGRKPSKLTAGNYLHYMFLFNISRKADLNMYELEYRLEKCVNQFNGNELGIISMGFFKTCTPIINPALLEKIIDNCIKDINQIEEISFTAIMKITRYSIGLNNLGKFRKLLYAVKPRIPSASTTTLVHTAHAAATVLAYEKEVIDEVLDKFVSCISTARLKDLERMLFSLAIFKYPKESPQYKLIIDELRNPRRTAELKKFSKCLTTSLMHLSYADIYPQDLIAKVLSPEYLKEVFNNNAFRIGRECMVVDMGLKIEVPEYKGPFLPERVINYLSKRYSSSEIDVGDPTGKVPSFQRFTLEFVQLLKEAVGSKDIIVLQVLPHLQRSEVLMCIDKENKIVPATPYFQKIDFSSIKYAPKEPTDCRWLAFILASHNHLFRGTTEPCGTLEAKIRQLKKIGYHPIVVPHASWYQSVKTLKEKKQYLKELLLQHDVNVQSQI
ncbi:FAST kinase domain-containing protein 5, mitochondrial [Cotesia typhae]|uniref:FAST kinase domain-containing protein 5, mitochondrial n=1 Tax=Cotesia typhae TaxID=2053667 RepID=UPI003D69D341